MMDYFSDRERGPRARTKLEVEAPAWGGLITLINSYISKGGFGIDFPEACPDGGGPTGTDAHAFGLALRAEIPDIDWPLRADTIPRTLSALDLVEFCHRHVAEPIGGSYHSFYWHSHLSFDRSKGQADFTDRVNRILSRNGVAFALESDGTVTRLAPPVLDEELRRAAFDTGDATLDALLEAARARFLDPDPATRREALEKLWDAWERLKTVEPGTDKKASATSLLDKAADEPNYRKLLEDEAKALTKIGNKFRIRHSETTQVEIQTEDQVDYFFHRLLALILLLVRAR
ncbi:MAG: hypothetical protein GXP25_17465 [Planctomycetes bacterium]|nr:hypothetical protein [Planctomycetota bacterium]